MKTTPTKLFQLFPFCILNPLNNNLITFSYLDIHIRRASYIRDFRDLCHARRKKIKKTAAKGMHVISEVYLIKRNRVAPIGIEV